MATEQVNYGVYGKCCRLTNGTVDVLVTTDLGPRVIYYGFTGGTNMLGEMDPKTAVSTELGDWHPLGGHRLWHAPEVLPRSYSPDNDPVETEIVGENAVRVMNPTEPSPKIDKEMLVELDARGTRVTVTHKLTNRNVWPVELAPWALTIMRGGGTTIFPQEPFISHDDYLLPARALVLWHFTDMSDPRWTWGKKYVRLKCDPEMTYCQKIGAMNKQGWAAYLLDRTLFLKRFPFIETATYPDHGCNFETYTDGDFMEVETLGPLTKLEPGASVTHTEQWYLFGDVDSRATEESLDTAMAPLIMKTASLAGP